MKKTKQTTTERLVDLIIEERGEELKDKDLRTILTVGVSNGHQQGFDDGYEDGHDDGYDDGYSDGDKDSKVNFRSIEDERDELQMELDAALDPDSNGSGSPEDQKRAIAHDMIANCTLAEMEALEMLMREKHGNDYRFSRLSITHIDNIDIWQAVTTPDGKRSVWSKRLNEKYKTA